MKFQNLFILGATLFGSFAVFGEIPEYSAPQILARANISDGFNIPAMSFLNNTSPVINNRGDVAFKIVSVEGENNQVLWVKKAAESAGKIVYVAPDERFLTDPSINDQGVIAFNLYDEGVTDGLFQYDSSSDEVTQALSPDNLPIQFYTYPQILNNNHIYFRATDDSNDRSFYGWSGSKLNKIMSEGTDVLGLKSSYLFKPSINQNGQIAFKSRSGEKGQWDEKNPDSILMLSPSVDPKVPGTKLTVIAFDQDTDTKSPYARFGNTVSLSNNGMVAFMGVLADLKKTIVVAKDNTLTTVASEGENDISEIEMYSPKINEKGVVLFRARDLSGKRGLYLADGNVVKRLIGEGDEIQTDLGKGSILYNPNFPGFGGEIDMNDKGEIVFYCLIIAEDNKELGAAVYKISPLEFIDR